MLIDNIITIEYLYLFSIIYDYHSIYTCW